MRIRVQLSCKESAVAASSSSSLLPLWSNVWRCVLMTRASLSMDSATGTLERGQCAFMREEEELRKKPTEA